MGKFIELTGKRIGRLVVLMRVGNSSNGTARFLCRCDCGTTKEVRSIHLNKETTQSCGCIQVENTKLSNTRHGLKKSKSYNTWTHMIQRCENPVNDSYKYYGSRGISVCVRWHKFENFYLDMGEKPEGLTLERIDNNKGYEPSNCKWATIKEQNCNKRTVRQCYL
jgi:hypothetical protein